MAINNIRVNPNSGSTPSSLLDQGINSVEGGILNSITQHIRNPAIAGAAESLLGALLRGTPSSGQFKAVPPELNNEISNIRNIFTELDSSNEFSKTCRYLVNIPPPACMNSSSADSLKFACHAAELPGVNITPVEFRHYAFTQRIAHYAAFSPITLSFYCFGGMDERKYFEFWMNQLVSFQSGLVRYPQDRRGNPLTTSDFTITQYGNDNIPNYIVQLFGAFPLAISPMTVNWADDRVHEMSITFGYTKWRTYDTDIDPGQILAPQAIPSGALGSTSLVTEIAPAAPAAAPQLTVEEQKSAQSVKESYVILTNPKSSLIERAQGVFSSSAESGIGNY